MFLQRLWSTAYLTWQTLGQRRYAFRPQEAIRRDQSRRVRRMVAYAFRHVPYYRETLQKLGLTPADFGEAEDIAKLPILERDQLARDPEYFLSDAVNVDRCARYSTSGTSGKPVTVYSDAGAALATAAHGERFRAVLTDMLGQRLGYRETSLFCDSGGTRASRRYWRQLTLLPTNHVSRHQRLDLNAPIEENAQQIAAFAPRLLAAYGSALACLFAYFRTIGHTAPLPDLAVYGADHLPDEARRLIEDEFGVPVITSYQSVEAPRIAFQCERRGAMHLYADLCPVRIVGEDGTNMPVGQPGDVVVSNLVNRATVILNYRLGDVAALLPDSCPCGRSLPLMSLLQGRSDDMFVLPSGGFVRPHGALSIFDGLDAVWQFQVVQTAPTRFHVRLVPSPACDREAVCTHIRDRLSDLTGERTTVEIEFVQSIPPGPSGKVRPIVCACRP